MRSNRLIRFVLAAIFAVALIQMHANAQSSQNACEFVEDVCTDIFCAANNGECIVIEDCLCFLGE